MRDSVQTRTVRDAILDATDDLLIKFGYKKMTIDDLAREVGIGKGTVYLHFPSKEEIALSHIDRIIEAWRRKRPDVDVRALGRFSREAAVMAVLARPLRPPGVAS